MIAHAKAHSHEWLNFHSEDLIKVFGHFNQAFNRYYYDEAKKYGFPVVVLDEDFDKNLDETMNILLQSSLCLYVWQHIL